MTLIGGRIFGIFFATWHECVVIHAEIGQHSAILKDLEICDFHQTRQACH